MNPEPTQQSAPTVWRKGWFYPAVAAPAYLIIGALVVFGGIEIAGAIAGLIVLGALFMAVGVGSVVTAFRRKLTITQDTLVIRTLFRTRVIPLAEITELHWAYGDNGLFAVKAVRIHAGRTTVSTKSFGTHQRDGMSLIADAAIARGAKIDGINAEQDVAHPENQ